MAGALTVLAASRSSAPRITLPTAFNPYRVATTSVSAGLTLKPDGTWVTASDEVVNGVWNSKPSSSGDYECLFQRDSGTLTSGAVGTWQSLSVARTWSVSAPRGVYSEVLGSLFIRRVGTTAILATASVNISADGGDFYPKQY